MIKVSVKLKITLWYVSILVLTSFLILYAMSSLSHAILKREVEERVVTSVMDFSRQLSSPETAPEGARAKIPEHTLYNNGVQLVMYDNNNNITFGRVPYGLIENIDFEDGVVKLEKYNNKEYYIFDKVILFNKDTGWVRGVICLTDELTVLNMTTQYSFLFILIFVILAGVGGYFIILRAFVPVNKIRMTAKEISESSDLSRRINLGSGGDEIHTLANTFDEMFDKLEASFKKEKQFTSDASHELRTPISVILTECEYGLECLDNVDELKETMGSIHNQATKMSKLVSELLTISRMDNNRLKINFEETDISELLEFVCEEQVEIQTKNIKLSQRIVPNLLANVDRLLMTRLFVNLISNAYQYSPENTEIIVSLFEDEDDNIVFSVKDNGIGISEDHINKIWDRFYQVDSSRTEDRNGSSGLGLSMVKWISDCHKGELKVNSKLGEGSEFIFVLKRGE